MLQIYLNAICFSLLQFSFLAFLCLFFSESCFKAVVIVQWNSVNTFINGPGIFGHINGVAVLMG